MKFGGHETFYLRPGWVMKGLSLVSESPSVIWNSDEASDAMGVGRNMSKSIGWWLTRAALIHRPARGEAIALTSLGHAVSALDPHLSRTATLWMLHLQLGLRGEDDVIAWLFREARDRRFTREALEGSLQTHLERAGEDLPAPKTLKRDVAVVLQAYARTIPQRPTDPEDNLDSPLRRLGLLTHRTDLDVFERRETATVVAAEVVASALCSLRPDDRSPSLTVALDDLGPMRRLGRLLGRDSGAMADLVAMAAGDLAPDLLRIRHLAGSREVLVRNLSPAAWLTRHLQRLHSAASDRAEALTS